MVAINMILLSSIFGVDMNLRLGCLFLTMLVLPLTGQVTAKQGTAADLKQSAFASPMVIEVPLDRLKDPEPGNVYPFTAQDQFVCDDVSIPLILITKSTTWSKRVKLSIKATAYVRPSYDRRVLIQCSILGGSGKTNPVTELQISAKEKQNRSDSSSLELSQDEFDTLFTGDSHGKLKLVMTVTPDR